MDRHFDANFLRQIGSLGMGLSIITSVQLVSGMLFANLYYSNTW